jgi:hypothetical protein
VLKRLILLLVVFAGYIFGFTSTNAQVVINEFSSYDTSGDWIELYAYEVATISGWIVTDTTGVMKTISSGVEVGPAAPFYILDVGNRLNRDGDFIKLFKEDGTTLVDQIPYGTQGGVCTPNSGETIGRYPDANNTIERFRVSTKSVSNNSAELNVCPVETSSPTSTSFSTPTPSPVASSTVTPVPTAAKTPTPKPTKTSSPTPKTTDLKTEVLGASDSGILLSDLRGQLVTEEPKSQDSDNKKTSFPVVSYVLISGGVMFIASALLLYWKKNPRYNRGSDQKI